MTREDTRQNEWKMTHARESVMGRGQKDRKTQQAHTIVHVGDFIYWTRFRLKKKIQLNEHRSTFFNF